MNLQYPLYDNTISIDRSKSIVKENTFIFWKLSPYKELFDNFTQLPSTRDYLETLLSDNMLSESQDRAIISHILSHTTDSSTFSINDIKIKDNKLYLLDPLSAQYIHLEQSYAETNPQDYSYLKDPQHIVDDWNHIFLSALHYLNNSLSGEKSFYPFREFVWWQIDITPEQTDRYCKKFTQIYADEIQNLSIEWLPDLCIPVATNTDSYAVDILYFVNLKNYKWLHWDNSPQYNRPKFSIL